MTPKRACDDHFPEVGKTTLQLGMLNEGDYILVRGPLGMPSHFDSSFKSRGHRRRSGYSHRISSGQKLHSMGVEVTSIIGFRTKDIILEKEVGAVSDKLIVMTDDGSNGNKGFVTDALKAEIEAGEKFDLVVAIGRLVMMKYVSQLTKQYGIKTIVSMNPVMIDGTGMRRLPYHRGRQDRSPASTGRISTVMKWILMKQCAVRVCIKSRKPNRATCLSGINGKTQYGSKKDADARTGP